MPREITTHRGTGANDAIRVTAEDEPGHGNACHRYRVCVPMLNPAESYVAENSRRARTYCDIAFQNGPIADGVNGITNEALLAVLIDRLEGFQRGPYACDENAIALDLLKRAMHMLQSRTHKRLARGVEGTHTV